MSLLALALAISSSAADCYTRYNSMFDDVENLMHALVDACMLARVFFVDQNEVHRFWRYCNMLHAAAYTSLTVAYSENNFFRPVCAKFDLYARDKVDRENEERLMSRVSLDGEDTRACTMLEIWLLELIKGELVEKADKPSPIFKNINDEVKKMGDSVKRLFSYQYQVLPFVYTHLVAMCCVLYLALTAFIKGLQFTPEASYTFGLLLPLASVLVLIVAIFGLLEVGDTILDPFGVDAEDFAVLHFVECTIVSSMEVIQVDSVVPRHKLEFYSNTELRAAIAVATRIVYRFRARKARRLREEEEREQQETEQKANQLPEAPVDNPRSEPALHEDAHVQSVPETKTTDHEENATSINDEEDALEFEVEPINAPAVSSTRSTPAGDDRTEFRLEGKLSEKPLKARPPSDMSFHQKGRKPPNKDKKSKERSQSRQRAKREGQSPSKGSNGEQAAPDDSRSFSC